MVAANQLAAVTTVPRESVPPAEAAVLDQERKATITYSRRFGVAPRAQVLEAEPTKTVTDLQERA